VGRGSFGKEADHGPHRVRRAARASAVGAHIVDACSIIEVVFFLNFPFSLLYL